MGREMFDWTNSETKTKNCIKVIAIMESQKGKRDELLNIVRELVKPSREEPGNISYILHLSMDNLNEIMFDEIWKDTQALENHFQQSHMKDIQKRIYHLLERPMELRIYSEL